MIGALQTGLFEILFCDMLGVAILARGDTADFLKVMAILAALVHRSHFGMKAMSKGNRVILDFNFVDENAIGTELDVFNRCAGARASAQAGIGERGVAADVALCTAVIRTGLRVGRFADQKQREEDGESE